MLGFLTMASAVSAAIAIAAGAFGAHAAQGNAIEWLRTGSAYQLVHAVAAIALAQRFPGASATLLAGSILFAATLYAMALGAPRWFGAITPIGGVLMMAGWLACAWSAWRSAG